MYGAAGGAPPGSGSLPGSGELEGTGRRPGSTGLMSRGKKKEDPREKLCFYCIPLRFGIFLAAFLTLGYGMGCCIGLFTDKVNTVVGGYAERTQLVVAWTGLLGIAGGWWGIVGCYDNNKSSLSFFWWYCLFRTLVGTLVFSVDMVTLYNCERFGFSLNSLMYHNYTMDRINRAGDCSYYRTLYICGWLIDVLTGCWVIFITHVYCQILDEREPEEYNVYYERRKRTLPRWFVSDSAAEGAHLQEQKAEAGLFSQSEGEREI